MSQLAKHKGNSSTTILNAIRMSKVKLATIVEGDKNALFSIATTPNCKEGRFSFPWIVLFYPWYVPHIAEY